MPVPVRQEPPVGPQHDPGRRGLARNRGRGGRGRGLLWGVGGVLLASAIWTVSVLAVPGIVAGHRTRPTGVAGYRVVDDLCATARLSRFGQLYPSQSGTPYHYTTRHGALDDMYCSQYRKKAGSDSEHYSLYLETQLHKAVDPAGEFEAQREGLRQRRYQISAVPDLGDDAYVGYLDDPSTSDRTWHYLTQVLYVRQGGMTFYAGWSGSYQEGKSAPPDREEVRVALLADGREVLRTLGGTL
ncbi:hypothetical protein [Kitasatospora camelliae]|uniref:Uncharacterized protein n=1 Tax=Kitasatospora camelliae TaxID=3156397 RepID=A0AAU8JUL2_9ACTN